MDQEIHFLLTPETSVEERCTALILYVRNFDTAALYAPDFEYPLWPANWY